MKKFLNTKGYETKTLRENEKDGLEEWNKASLFLKTVARNRMNQHKAFFIYVCANFKVVDNETFLIWGD